MRIDSHMITDIKFLTIDNIYNNIFYDNIYDNIFYLRFYFLFYCIILRIFINLIKMYYFYIKAF